MEGAAEARARHAALTLDRGWSVPLNKNCHEVSVSRKCTKDGVCRERATDIILVVGHGEELCDDVSESDYAMRRLMVVDLVSRGSLGRIEQIGGWRRQGPSGQSLDGPCLLDDSAA